LAQRISWAGTMSIEHKSMGIQNIDAKTIEHRSV
jgi:hypothetical protein